MGSLCDCCDNVDHNRSFRNQSSTQAYYPARQITNNYISSDPIAYPH